MTIRAKRKIPEYLYQSHSESKKIQKREVQGSRTSRYGALFMFQNGEATKMPFSR